MNIYDMTFKKLSDFFEANGVKKSWAEAVFKALYREKTTDLNSLVLPEKAKKSILDNFTIPKIECIGESDSETAVKYLFKLSDGNLVETVVMKHKYGGSVCVSTQAGCNMGCKFCRSGRLKKIRNLTAGEITGQLLFAEKHSGVSIGGVSVMGIGEPFDNFENVLDFTDIIMYQKGLAVAPRKITVSTCGIIPKINELKNRGFAANIAVSLHAPNNEIRSRIMPINDAYPVDKLMETVKDFSKTLNKRVALEYIMLKGVNDSEKCAEELSRLIGDSKCYVNIIRYNKSDDDIFECSDFQQIMRFYDVLKRNNIGVTMRREMGSSVNAACGQLRSDYITK